jgi:hypothetical protein
MTAAPALYVDTAGELRLPLPLQHQRPMMDSPARFKVRRAGRREGKTTLDFVAAMGGHGPGWQTGDPMWQAVLQGWDVVWIAKDYPQARAIWQAEIEPRCRGLDGATLNVTERTVKFSSGGTLHIRSAEKSSLMGIRGLGKRVKGVICDEGAWWDLRYAWQKILRPILADNQGWAIITSTTNKGSDGGIDDETGNIVTPSYFNRLCQAVMDGAAGRTLADGWAHFYGTAADNPKITAAEFRALLQEYVPGSLDESQEVYAKLLTGGAGLAFHEWREDLHVTKYDPPAGWRWFAGLDWGYRNPYAIVIFAAGPDDDVLARYEMYGKGRTPFEVGYDLGQKARGIKGRIEWVSGDSAMWAVTDGGESIAQEFQRGLTAAAGGSDPIALISAPKGPGSRATRVQILHEHLRFETLPAGIPLPGGLVSDGTAVPPWAGPKLRFHVDCANCIRTIPALPIDPKNTEDVDTDAEDHAYDAVTYALQSRVPRPEKVENDRVPDDIHPGFKYEEGRAVRRPRWEREQEPEDTRREVLRQGHYITGVRVGGARPYQEG